MLSLFSLTKFSAIAFCRTMCLTAIALLKGVEEILQFMGRYSLWGSIAPSLLTMSSSASWLSDNLLTLGSVGASSADIEGHQGQNWMVQILSAVIPWDCAELLRAELLIFISSVLKFSNSEFKAIYGSVIRERGNDANGFGLTLNPDFGVIEGQLMSGRYRLSAIPS